MAEEVGIIFGGLEFLYQLKLDQQGDKKKIEKNYPDYQILRMGRIKNLGITLFHKEITHKYSKNCVSRNGRKGSGNC